MFDTQHFTRDAADVRFDTDADGIIEDDDGAVQFEWDEVETVTIEDPPHAEAFDAKEFYKLPATVAKPIPQPYQFGDLPTSSPDEAAKSDDSLGESVDDGVTWLKKPREELKQAAWSLDNSPWTMGHPDTGMVKSVDDVHGFWGNPRYIDSMDDLDADLHVPTNDSDAQEYIEDHQNVSVGFYNRVARIDEYDGVVGGTDDPDIEVEGYQTDMLFDHVASVPVGRCPSEEGCGLDSHVHGHVETVDAFKRGTDITHISDDTEESADSSEGTVSMQETTDQPSGIYTADGTWFAVGPDEHPDESTEWPDDAKFPVDNCSDIEDAWNLRGSGDVSIEESTLESRIRRAADAKDCDLPDTAEQDAAAIADSAKRYSICGCRAEQVDHHVDLIETTDDNTHTMEFEIDLDDLSTGAALTRVADQHEGVAERLDELRAYQDAAEAAEEAADEIDIDNVQDLADAIGVLKEERDSLEEALDEARRPQMEEDAEAIAERTERFGEDAEEVIENLDEDPEKVAEKRELVEDLSEGFDEATANAGGSDEGGSPTVSATYAKTPWE